MAASHDETRRLARGCGQALALAAALVLASGCARGVAAVGGEASCATDETQCDAADSGDDAADAAADAPPGTDAAVPVDATPTLDAGAEVDVGAATAAQNMTCQAQLAAHWATTPPAVGVGSLDSSASYDSVIGGLMATYGVPGGAVAVTHNGQLVLARAWGFADTASQQPAHPAQLFRIASLSKQLTATAILQLVQAGKLSLDAPAFAYLPDLQPLPGKAMNAQLTTVTIRQLLNHTGGWNRDHEAVGDPMFGSIAVAAALGTPGPASADDTIRYMLDKPTSYAPGATYCYSNFGYAVLGAIIARVAATPYLAYVQQNILTPQHISDMAIGGSLASQTAPDEVSYYDYPGDGLAKSVFPDVAGLVPWPYGGFNMAALMAHGGWIASPVDMLRFTTGVDKYGGPPTLVAASSLTAMLANPAVASCNADGSTTATSAASWYGFGFQVNKYGNYWHTGSLPGTATEDVIANNGFHFAAFFNTRPSNASQFATDLDNALWTAFNGVSSWSGDDNFDQYGAWSAWTTAAAYAAVQAAAVSAGQYPARVEGKSNGKAQEFRAQLMPLHAGATFQSGFNLDCVGYRASAAQAQQAGLSLISLQTFTDASGLTRYQATWKSP